MKNFEKCLTIIEKIENRSYRGKNRVVVTVDDVANLADLFEELSHDDKDFIKSFITEKVGRILIGFTGEMAKKAVDSKDSKWLKRAIIMHILEDVSVDYRENLRELFLLTPALKLLGISQKELWESVIYLASDRVKQYLMKKLIN